MWFSVSLRLFQKFDTFRILVCGGDGSVGWVLSEIDALTLHKQVQRENYVIVRDRTLQFQSSQSQCVNVVEVFWSLSWLNSL